jgi:ABC-type nitrate/sulfonate/bicarbonate transport system substrate-binding protein
MLVGGAVDAMAGLEPFLTLTQEQMGDKATILLRLGAYVQGGGLFLISDQWAAAHPDKIGDAVAALWESQQWVRRNTKEATVIESEFLKVEPRIVEVAFKWLNFNPLIDDFTRQSLQKTSDYLANEKLIPVAIKPDDYLVQFEQIAREVKAKHPELLE